MKLGYELTIKQKQQLSMTPEMMQSIRILQFNSTELLEFVDNALTENPVLEEEELWDREEEQRIALEISDRIAEEDLNEMRAGFSDSVPVAGSFTAEGFATKTASLQEYLLEQLRMLSASKELRKVCEFLIAAVDDNGYLTESPEEICARAGCDRSVFEEAHVILCSMDPAGVGAGDLTECLTLQLQRQGCYSEEMAKILNEMLPEVAANKIDKIAKNLNVTVPLAQEYVDRIRALDPKPGRGFADASERVIYVIPDVFVEKKDDRYQVYVNQKSAPRLRISSYYRQLSEQSREDPELAAYLTDRFNTANRLIRSIEQRKETILQVSAAIVSSQKEFFEHGERYIRPMTLKQIAGMVGVHESTVSRAVNGKYMQTPRGVFEIRSFFTGGVTAGEETLSSRSVKVMIREIIENEDSGKPQSDRRIAELLCDRDIAISRRTVAKYRGEMGIPSSSRRRRF